MGKSEQIINKLKALTEKPHYDTSALIVGMCKAVNGEQSIDVEVDEITYHDVQLQAIQQGSSNSILLVPSKGSMVLIGNIENSSGYVLLHADQVDRIMLKQKDGKYIDIKKSVVLLNGDAHGGLVMSDKVAGRLNTLENSLNELKLALSAWVPVSSDGGAALKIAITTWASQIMDPTQKTFLENQNVKHG